MKRRVIVTMALLVSASVQPSASQEIARVRATVTVTAWADTGGTAAPAGTQTVQAADTADLKLIVAAEGRSSVPPGSKMEWQGVADTCRTAKGENRLRPADATVVTLPVCKVKLTLFVTGFTTQAITLDLPAHQDIFSEPIHIALKLNGPAEVTWERRND